MQAHNVMNVNQITNSTEPGNADAKLEVSNKTAPVSQPVNQDSTQTA
jgi:hypothetical protein